MEKTNEINQKLKETIYKRKSIRQYKMESLSPETLAEIENFIGGIKPLHHEIQVYHRIVQSTKNILPIKAPHYILIYSEEKEGWLNNIGFIFQQLDLYLAQRGLGSCWLGMAKPKENEDKKKDFVIAMCFGEPAESLHRQSSEFKRKPADQVYKGTDKRLEAARLAPSAGNSQNWFFDEEDGHIHIYQKVLTPLQNLLYGKMNQIDSGIAICHMYLVGLTEGKEFEFTKKVPQREIKGFHYIGTVG